MSIIYQGTTYSSVKKLCESHQFNYENFRFRAKKIQKKTSELSDKEISSILTTPPHPGRQQYADYKYEGKSFRSAESLVRASGTEISLSAIKARLKKITSSFNELDNREKTKLLFDSTYPSYTREVDSLKNSISSLIEKYEDKGTSINRETLIKDLRQII